MTWAFLKDAQLRAGRVLLRRVQATDVAAFSAIAYEPEIWRYFVSTVNDEHELRAFIENAVRETLNGTRIVYAITDAESGAVLGSTAFGNLAEADKRLEIGWSWVSLAARRSGVNRFAKLALLEHAFGPLGCERVEFKTDVLNLSAQRALEGIGARREGVLRSFNFMPGGRRRDVVYYSILRGEWAIVKEERFPGSTRND